MMEILRPPKGVPEMVAALKDRALRLMDYCSPPQNTTILYRAYSKTGLTGCRGRPSDIARVFGSRPVAVMGASPGGFGTVLPQNAWLPVLRTLGMRPWFGGSMMVSQADKVFDQNGEIVDQHLRGRLQQFINGFIDFVRVNGVGQDG